MPRAKRTFSQLNQRTQQVIREKIRAHGLIRRLQDEAFGKLQLTDGQRDSAKFLVSKAISAPIPKGDDGEQAKGLTVLTWQQ
jgi:hypothetical protein